MIFIITPFIFIISLFLGSFLNVVIDRLVREEQFIKGRSYCEKCKHELSAKDLLPVVSFLTLKGRCRYCKGKIPKTLPLFELITAISITAISLWFFNNFSLADLSELISPPAISFYLFLIVTTIVLLLILFMDLKYMLIPDIFLIALVGIYVLGYLINLLPAISWGQNVITNIYYVFLYGNLLNHLVSALWLFGFFGFLYFVTKGKAMGKGDVYLAPALGIFLPFLNSVVMWYATFIFGAFISVFLLILKRKKLKSMIPFGPFLIFGFIFSIFVGNNLIKLYLQLTLR